MRKLKKKERKKMACKSKNFMFGFLDLVKVSGTYRVDLALEQRRDLVCKLFSLLCFVFFLGTAPIHVPYMYVQATILKLSISN